MWDVFISHAWEDKEDIARPLAETLRRRGLRVWYDEYTLTLGDSLRRSIDRGLAQSKYGIVILSPNFFAKEWPQRELDGLVAKEVSSGKTILPVWHNVTWEDVRPFSPILADKLAVSTAKGLDVVVEEILRVLRVDKSESVGKHQPKPRPGAKRTPAQPGWPVSWERVGATAGVIIGVLIALGTCIALGLWLVPKATDLLSAWLFVTPTSSLTYLPTPTATDTPTNTPTSTPVPPTDTSTPEPPTSTLTPTPINATVKAEALNLRTGPGVEYAIVGQLQQGDIIIVIARNLDGDWLEVEHEGKTGWVSKEYLEAPEEVARVPTAEVPPTNTPFPPTATPTFTPVPPTPMPVPPTDTPTPIPPTPEPVLPTNTPLPLVSAPPSTVYHVPAGEFIMGSSGDEVDSALALCHEYRRDCERSWFECEEPQHTVYLDAFYIDGTEVTNAQYRACVEAGACDAPSDTTYYNDADYAQHPVVFVSWDHANAYCQWAGKRLPTEAEWEKAAGGTDGRTFPWGEGIDCDRAQYGRCGGQTVPVGSKPQGVSPYGALDIAGNVWEWVADWYDSGYYASSPESNPEGPVSGDRRGIRGGSWGHSGATVRAAARNGYSPGGSYASVGFRCAKDAE